MRQRPVSTAMAAEATIAGDFSSGGPASSTAQGTPAASAISSAATGGRSPASFGAITPGLRGLCRRFCIRCCPGSVSVVKSSALLVVLGSFVLMIFGRSIVSLYQGLVAIAASLECYYAASKGYRKWLAVYAAFMCVDSIFCLFFGATILIGIDFECAHTGSQQPTCIATQSLYGLALALGSSGLGMFAAINTALAAAAMPSRHSADESEVLLIH
jgi:hypothetical protein